MKTLFAKAGLALALGATALTFAAPAQAQRYDRGYRNHDNGGTAVVAGIAGLAIGAALASSGDGYRDGYYEQDYYGGPGYDPYLYQDYGPVYQQRYYAPIYQQRYYSQRGYSQRGYNRRGYDHYDRRGGYDRGHDRRGYRGRR